MLNGANLALIGFSRHYGEGDGQIFALAVMAVAASEVVVGPRPGRRAQPQARHARRRPAQHPARLIMVYGAWICLLSPLAAALLITLGGRTDLAPHRRLRRDALVLRRLRRRARGVHRAARPRRGRPRASSRQRGRGSPAARTGPGLEVLIDPLSVFMMLIVSGVGALIVAYSIGYMDGDDEERRYFAYMSLFVFSMLLLVQGGNLLLLLAGWGMVGLSSYLLIGFWHERPSAIAAAKKAFVMNAIGDATMALAFFLLIKEGELARVRHPRRRVQLDDGEPRRARPARRRGREVGAAPAADVASGRDGGPDAGQRAHPRGDDGDRRRLPDRPHARDLRAGADDRRPRRRARRGDAARRRPDRARAGRHQARDRLLDDVADRLHVPRRRHRLVRERRCST